MSIKIEPIAPDHDLAPPSKPAELIGEVIKALIDAGGGMVKVDELSDDDRRTSPVYGIAVAIASRVAPEYIWSKRIRGTRVYIVAEARS